MLTRIIATEPRCRLRGIETITVQCMPVRVVIPPRLGLASFYGALARSHLDPYPTSLRSCLRTHEEALETFKKVRYHDTGLYAGVSSHLLFASLPRWSKTWTGVRILAFWFSYREPLSFYLWIFGSFYLWILRSLNPSRERRR